MNASLSTNTQAILMLTAPLMVPGARDDAPVLKPREYRRLAQWLHANGMEPAGLLEPAAAVIEQCPGGVAPDRLRALLDRGFRMAQALERWQARSIWVLSRADAGYPTMVRARLKGSAPVLLYGCGPLSLLDRRGLAVVGSRDAGDALLRYAADNAAAAARAGLSVVSGGAKGVDRAAMNGALEAGGHVTGVLPGGLERAAVNPEHRTLLLEERLVLLSLCDPRAGFNVGNAMARNKLVYGLADAALVVDATEGKGGTWAGAEEELKRGSGRVFVRSTLESSAGLAALLERGARGWPNPERPDDLEAVLAALDADDADDPEVGSPNPYTVAEEARDSRQLEMFGK